MRLLYPSLEHVGVQMSHVCLWLVRLFIYLWFTKVKKIIPRQAWCNFNSKVRNRNVNAHGSVGAFKSSTYTKFYVP